MQKVRVKKVAPPSRSGRTLRSPDSVHVPPPPHFSPEPLPEDDDDDDDNDDEEEEENDDDDDVTDPSGNRRSRRVAKLKRIESSDDSDEDYSPIKKKLFETTSKNGRKKIGRPSTTGVTNRVNNKSHQQISDDSSPHSDADSDASPTHNLQNGGTSHVNAKRVVIKLNLNNQDDGIGKFRRKDDINNPSSNDTGNEHHSTSESESETINSTSNKPDILNQNINESESEAETQLQKNKSKVMKSSSYCENSESGSSKGSSSNDEQSSAKSDSSHNKETEKRRKFKKCIKSGSSSESENSDSSDESDKSSNNENRHTNKRNGTIPNRTKFAPSIGRKMPIYKGSLIPAIGMKRKKEESSEFECDDRESVSSEYSEDKDKKKCGKKRRKLIEREDLLQDNYLVDDKEFIDNDGLSDNSESSSSEESDSDSDAPQRKKKRKLKHTKGIVKSSAKAGKKIPLKYKASTSSRGRGKKSVRGGRNKNKSVVREVRDGEQIIGTVHIPRGCYVDSDDKDYTGSGKKTSSLKRKRQSSTKGSPKDQLSGDEVRKSGRNQKKIYYDEDDDYFDFVAIDDYDLNVSSRGRVRKANTLMKDFI